MTEAGKYASNFMYKGATQSNSKSIALTSVDGLSLKPVRRQDLDQTWWRNGAIYIFETENITKLNEVIVEPVLGYEMPWRRSINIDELQDVHFGEYLWESQQNQLHE